MAKICQGVHLGQSLQEEQELLQNSATGVQSRQCNLIGMHEFVYDVGWERRTDS